MLGLLGHYLQARNLKNEKQRWNSLFAINFFGGTIRFTDLHALDHHGSHCCWLLNIYIYIYVIFNL